MRDCARGEMHVNTPCTSRSSQCPTVGLHLMTTKIMQQVHAAASAHCMSEHKRARGHTGDIVAWCGRALFDAGRGCGCAALRSAAMEFSMR
jgi:hypothetical protein